LAPKLPNDATQYLDGTGAYSVPAGTGGGTQIYYGISAAGSDDYVINPSPALGAYADGVIVILSADVTSGASARINVSGLGLVDIKKSDGTALNAGDIRANGVHQMVYQSATGDMHLVGYW